MSKTDVAGNEPRQVCNFTYTWLGPDTLIWQHWTAWLVGHFKKVSSIVQGKGTGSEVWVFSRSGLFKMLLTLWFCAFHLTLISASVNCGKYDPSGGLIMGIN